MRLTIWELNRTFNNLEISLILRIWLGRNYRALSLDPISLLSCQLRYYLIEVSELVFVRNLPIGRVSWSLGPLELLSQLKQLNKVVLWYLLNHLISIVTLYVLLQFFNEFWVDLILLYLFVKLLLLGILNSLVGS